MKRGRTFIVALALLAVVIAILAACQHASSEGKSGDSLAAGGSRGASAATESNGRDAVEGGSSQSGEGGPGGSSGEEGAVSGRAPSDGEWESPFEGLDRPVSELEVVAPGVVKAPEGGMFWTIYLGVWFHGSYSDDRIREIISQMGCEELTWYRSRALDRVATKLKLSGGSDLEETARAFLSLEEVEKVFPEEFNPLGHAGSFAGGGELVPADPSLRMVVTCVYAGEEEL